MRKITIVCAAVVALGVAACGDDEEATPAAASVPAASSAAYTPVSDVASHAAIGSDVAAIRELLEPAAEGGEADFVTAGQIFAKGRSSKKGDGSLRTLAGFVEGSDIATHVADAVNGRGTAAALDVAERRQWIDKGMTVALKVKVLEELGAAAEKLAAGETDAAEGAPHNVDEAWAFFGAGGEGVALTATKRAADFGLAEDELSRAVIDALSAAQRAAAEGDERGFENARDDARGALNRIFALAVKKYAVEGGEDPVARQEGRAFSWALSDDLPPDARRTLTAAFNRDADQAAVDALAAMLDEQATALGYRAPLPDYPTS